jgi:hypothetical protein
VSLVPRLPQSRPNREPSVNRGSEDGLTCGRRAESVDRRRRERVCDIFTMCANGKTAIAKIRPNPLCQNARSSCSQAVRSFCLRPHVSKICRYRFNRVFETSARDLGMMPKVPFRPYYAVQWSVKSYSRERKVRST